MIGILVDVTLCNGCNQCVDACVTANNLGEERYLPQQAGDGLSARRWSSIVESPEGRQVRKFCRHCLEPACVSVCPAGAMYKTAEGPVLYDSQKCLGCRYCMMACPFGIPRYEWDTAIPLVKKCTLCYERLQAGQRPACVEVCPNQVLTFGDRDDLLRRAHQRIQAEAGKYLPVVFGEQEAGGTSVMYLSDVPLDFKGGVGGFHGDPGQVPMPDLSWNWLGKVPALSIATAGVMTGLFWIIGRRIQMEEARAARQAKEA